MKTNELCTQEEFDAGYSAHEIGFGIMCYKGDKPFMQFATEEEMHEWLAIIKEGGDKS